MTKKRITRRSFLAAAVGLWASFRDSLQAAPRSAEAKALEYRVKAAFLFNFVRFVEWPESHAPIREAFVIGVYGADPFGSILRQTTRGKNLAGHSIEIRRAEDIDQAADCDVLFIADSERESLADILGRLQGTGVLTVGESRPFLDHGGMINFVIERERVRFEVDLDAVRAEGLDLSSQLLKVARDVRFKGKER